jgi:hypothetical protein
MTTRKRPGRPSKSARIWQGIRRAKYPYPVHSFAIGGAIATFSTPNPSPEAVEAVRAMIEAVGRIGPENLPNEARK